MKNEKYPLVSIVLLNWNGLKYLKKTVPAILKLNYPNYEFIVVDNGSIDGSIGFIKKNKKIKLIKNKKNLGYSKGKNIGAKKAKGKYILLLDNDILVKDKKILEKLVKIYKKEMGFIQIPLVDSDKKETIYYGLYFNRLRFRKKIKSISINKIINYSSKLIPIGGATGACMFILNKNWGEIGKFDESQKFNIDDIDIGPRAIILGFKNYLYTSSYFIHLGIKSSKNNKMNKLRYSLTFFGTTRSIIKNCKFINLPVILSMYLLKYFFLLIFYFFANKNIFYCILNSFKISFFLFPDTLKQRKKIQSKRIIKEDTFLKIKPPKFD